MRATAQLPDFLKQAEGFKQFASPCSSGDYYPAGDPFEGVRVHDLGYGCRSWEDGTLVYPGDEINSHEAEALMVHRIETEFEPAIPRLFPGLQFSPGEWDAMVSWLYNFGETKAARYPIRNSINAGKKGEALARQWVKYCNPDKPDIRLGLYRRRVAEVLMREGLPYQRGLECAYREDVWDIVNEVRRNLGIPEVPSAKAVPAPALIPAPPSPKPEPKMPRQMTLPDEWDKMTEKQQVAWLNTGEFVRIGGTVGEPIKPAPLPEAAKAPASVQMVKKVIETPNLKPDAPPKPMEQSQTHRGLSKADSGREAAIVSTTVLGGVAYSIPHADKLTAYVEKYPPQTIFMVLGILAGMGVLYGLWRYWAGLMIAEDGRRKAEGPKV